MPISDEHLQSVVREFLDTDSYEESVEKLTFALRLVYNTALTDAANFLRQELDKELIKVVVPNSQKLIGRMPWYIRKNSLEKRFKSLEHEEPASSTEFEETA